MVNQLFTRFSAAGFRLPWRMDVARAVLAAAFDRASPKETE